MKQFFLSMGCALLAFLSFINSTIKVVMSVVLAPFRMLKTYVDICDHMLSALVVMMYSASVSGAVFIGNKIFGSAMFIQTVEADRHRLQC